jgi:PST family polysaccharide transporter
MTQAPAAGSQNVIKRAARGVAWMLPTSLGARGVGLVGTLVLARYLAPAEYGEVSAASIVAVTAHTISAFGVGIYLVANRELSREQSFHATCWFIAMGGIALTAVWALAGPLGRWCDAPNLERFLPIFLVSTLLDRVSFLPERMLIRKLRFRWLSLSRASSEIAYTVVSLAMAAHGAGAMAIAWGNLARSLLRFAAIVPAVEWREWLEPHRLRLATMGRMLGFGLKVSFTSLASYGMSRWDNLLVSRYFGPAAMGAYNYAYNLAETPAIAVGEQVCDVVGASFPHIDREKRPSALVRSVTMISLVMLPLAFGLGAVAPTVVQVFFDHKWSSVGAMLVSLSVLSATRPMTLVLQSYLYASDRPGTVLCLEWLSLAAIVAAIGTVGRNGVLWACGAVGAAFVLRTLAAFWAVHRQDGIPMSSFLQPLLRPITVCASMVATIALARPALHGLPPALRLLVEVALGAVVYLAGALLVFRSTSSELLSLVRSARK